MSGEMARDFLPFEQTAYMETVDGMSSKQLAHAIVHYALCGRPDMESADEQTVKAATERVAEIIALYRRNEWQSLFAVLGTSLAEYEADDNWDNSPVDLEKLTTPEFIKAQHDLISASNPELLKSLNEKLLWHSPVADDDEGCLFDEKRLPNKGEVIETVNSYVGMQQRFAECAIEMTRYIALANHFCSNGMKTKLLLTSRVSNVVELMSFNLYQLAKVSFKEMIACLKMAQKLPAHEQKEIFGFDLSECDLDRLSDDTCNLGEKIAVKRFGGEPFNPCEGFTFLCEYLVDFFGLTADRA